MSNTKLTKKEIKKIREKNMNLKFIDEEDIDLKNYFGCVYMTIFLDEIIYSGSTQKIPGTTKFNNYFGSGSCKDFKEAIKSHKGKLIKRILHVVYKDGFKNR